MTLIENIANRWLNISLQACVRVGAITTTAMLDSTLPTVSATRSLA